MRRQNICGRKALALLLVLLLLVGAAPLPGAGGTARAEESPGLEIQSITTAPETIKAGEEVTVSAAVYNSSETESGPFTVALYAGSDPDNMAPVDEKEAASLEAGSAAAVDFTWTPAEAGPYDLTVKIILSDATILDEMTLNIEVEPQEEEAGPLQIVELFPAHGATEVPLDTEIYIRFNKPANIESIFPLFLPQSHIGIGGQQYLLESNDDYTKWSLARNSASLEWGRTYSVDSFMIISDKETGAILYDPQQPSLDPFPAWEFTTAELEGPSSISISDYPRRLQVGQSYPLHASVQDKRGNILDWPVEWEVVRTRNGRAVVDAEGNLTGSEPGYINIIVRPQGYPDLSHTTSVEIRQNFDKHLLGVWATVLTDRETFNSILVGEEGTIYLATGVRSPVIRAYDSEGNRMEDFQEISGIRYPVLAKIGGREYLLGFREKRMCAFDPLTGRLEWQSAALEYDLGKPVVDLEGNIYAGSISDGKVYAFRLESDRYLWSRYVQYSNVDDAFRDTYAPITVGPGSLIYVKGNDRVTCLDSGGAVRWQYIVPTPGLSLPAGVEVDSQGNVYFLQRVDTGTRNYNIYALDPQGGYRWHVPKTEGYVYNLFVDVDDSVYVSIRDEVAGTERLTRLNPADGSVEREFAVYGCDRFLRPGDGYIYTSKFIFNDNLEVVGYTDLEAVGYADDYYLSLPYMSYSLLAPTPDGTLVRVVKSGDTAVALEKVTLMETAGAVPRELEVEENEITLIQGGTRDIFAQVKDERGYLIPYVALTYETADENVATVDETGRISAVSPGDTIITVRVQDYTDIYTTITLHVLPPGEVTDIYFVNTTWDDEIDLQERISSISFVVGERRSVSLVVLDQRGQVIQNLPIAWTLSDSTVVQMYNYSGGIMGSGTKGTAALNGLKEGSATLKAELEGYSGFSAELTVQVEPSHYELLWTMPLEGDWNNKVGYHDQAADGTLFIANRNKLKAVSSTGALLWEENISESYGFMPATPLVDGSNLYVYDLSGFNCALVALNPQDGSPRWSFSGGLGGVQQLRAGAGGVYLLASGGTLYGLERESGGSLWETPLELGRDDGTLGLSPEGTLYYTRGHQLFRVAPEGSAIPLYTAQDGALLAIKEIAPDGRLILQKEAAGSYSILCVDASGTESWEVAVELAVELSCGSDGTVYAVTKVRNDLNPRLYIIEADGTLRADRVIPTHRFKTIGAYQIYYKPQVGSDGIVYLPLCRLYAVNAADGALLWSGEFNDGFFNRVPRTATLDENNVLYLACDDYGFVALRSKVAGVADESGFYIDTAGLGSLRGGTYRNLTFRVGNNNETPGEIRVVMALEEVQGEKVLNYAAAADLLAPGEYKVYQYGLQIPGTGTHQISIKLLDWDNQLLTEKILPVS